MMIIPIKELSKREPDKSNENTDLYFLNRDLLLKRIKKLDYKRSEYLLKKYQYARNAGTIQGLNLPIDIFVTEYGQAEGYIEKVIPGTLEEITISFEDYWKRVNLSLDVITNYILQINEIVNRCHELDIVNPDLSGKGNVLYDKRNGQVYLTDYHDMQVEDLPGNNFSNNIFHDTVLYSPKYKRNGLWTKNIDRFTIAIRYLYYTTGFSIESLDSVCSVDKYRDALKKAGLAGTKLADYIIDMYESYYDNPDISDAIIELNKDYVLENSNPPLEKGKIRKFVKKSSLEI